MPTGFSKQSLTFLDRERDVYFAGAGPSVVLIAEIPGITPGVAGLGRRLVDDGFRVAMPDLFGKTDAPFSTMASLREGAVACISREFHVLAANRPSPITNWLRALCRHMHETYGGPVGAIGMCLTGNFALALAVDPWLMAPVVSQPSLPFPLTARLAAGLHVGENELVTLRRRCAEEDLKVLGLRFTHDKLCPAARFRALERELGDAFEAIEIDSGPGNPRGFSRAAHSVLVLEYSDESGHPTHQAYRRVVTFLSESLSS